MTEIKFHDSAISISRSASPSLPEALSPQKWLASGKQIGCTAIQKQIEYGLYVGNRLWFSKIIFYLLQYGVGGIVHRKHQTVGLSPKDCKSLLLLHILRYMSYWYIFAGTTIYNTHIIPLRSHNYNRQTQVNKNTAHIVSDLSFALSPWMSHRVYTKVSESWTPDSSISRPAVPQIRPSRCTTSLISCQVYLGPGGKSWYLKG